MTQTPTTLESELISQENHRSLFETELLSRPIEVCDVFRNGACEFTDKNGLFYSKEGHSSVSGKRIAVLFSGGPAAGGHNVVAGLKAILGDENTLFGVKAGPKGLIQGDLFELTQEKVNGVVNTGGFDLLGSDRTKIKTDEQFNAVRKTVETHRLDGIVVVGGDDSNTNAAFLAERLADLKCCVVGVPKTIDGDLQWGSQLPISFGFDTATKIYAELVGNILQDTPSSRKYWHFVKLMGRSASHVALEVALQTKPPVTFISEEVLEKNWSLSDVVDQVVDAVLTRAEKGLLYGVVLVPEGLIEFIPEFKRLIAEISTGLSEESRSLLESLPDKIREQLLGDRDSHGNLKVSQIPTEELLILMVQEKLKSIQKKPDGFAFNALNHFFGYEGRCGAPTCFDADYTFNLGATAASLILRGKTGVLSSLAFENNDWKPIGIPLSELIVEEIRQGKTVQVIEKALVELKSPAFKFFDSRRAFWKENDVFCSPGPRQYEGVTARQLPMTVALNLGADSLRI